MKKTGFIYKIVLFILSVFVSFNLIFAQDNKTQDVRSLIQSRNFIFKADQMIPSGFSSRNITAENYDLRLLKDSISIMLPYMGRAYTAVYNSTEGGIRLNSKNFNYKIADRKKGGWNITIEPENSDIRQMFLTVSENGFASLNVTSTNRQSISYTGRIVQGK
jgi:hypothetical protein